MMLVCHSAVGHDRGSCYCELRYPLLQYAICYARTLTVLRVCTTCDPAGDSEEPARIDRRIVEERGAARSGTPAAHRRALGRNQIESEIDELRQRREQLAAKEPDRTNDEEPK